MMNLSGQVRSERLLCLLWAIGCAGSNIHVTPAVLGNGATGNDESDWAGKRGFFIYCGPPAMQEQTSMLHE